MYSPVSQNSCVQHANYTHSCKLENQFELDICSIISNLGSNFTDFFVNGTLA